MDQAQFLAELTALSYAARARRLFEAGRESRTRPPLAAIFQAWERGNWEERLYSLQSCAGSGEEARLLRLVDDPSRVIARGALDLLAVHGSDEVLIQALLRLTPRRRTKLLARLRSRRRFTPVDAFLAQGLAQGLARVAELLPFGSADAVRRHFAEGESRGGYPFWDRLARHHPRIALEEMLRKFAAAEAPDALVRWYAMSILAHTGATEPDLTVRLVEALARVAPAAYLRVEEALYRRPAQLAEVVLSAEGPSFSLARGAPKIDAAMLARILRERPQALPLDAEWLAKLPGADRAALYEAGKRSWRNAEGLIPDSLLALLPARERMAEAERMVALPIMETRPALKATYAAYLSWPQMREIVDRYLTHPEGESRAAGWGALLTSLGYHRSHAAEVLALIRKRKFEQDPVRLVILANLAKLPQGTWRAEHLPELAGIIREALDATDLSPASAMFVTTFAQKLITSQPQWAAAQLAMIYAERGNIGGYFLEPRINDEQALILEEAFLQVGSQWGKGNRVGWLVWFAMALGKRLRVCKRLLKTLASLLGNGAGYYDTSVLQLLRQALPYAEFESLAEKLLASHESWVALQPMFQFLHRHRQDWLEPHLSKTRFKMSGKHFIELTYLLPAHGYHRYTQKQQAILAGTLHSIIWLPAGDQLPKDVWTMLRAMNSLALLPATDPARLIELSSDTRPMIADSATRALGRLDGGQGIPALIAALGDARARVAIYALRQAMADLPAARVVGQLSHAPLEKVTVAKETIRLIGEFGGAAGLEWLVRAASQNLHRDVRIALLRGLWDHLEDPRAWDFLREAARSADGQVLNGVVRIPADRLSRESRRQLIDLLTGLASHSDAIIRLAVLQRFVELPLPDEEGRLIGAAMQSLAARSQDERHAAARVIAANSTSSDVQRIAEAIGAQRAQRRLLQDFVTVLLAEAFLDAAKRRRLMPLAARVVEILRTDPYTAGLRLRLAAGILGFQGFEQELGRLIGEQFPIAAIQADAAIALQQLRQSPEQAQLAPLEERLASAADPQLRRLALTVLFAQACDQERWSETRRSRLEKYRADLAPEVAIPAQFFFEAEEE